MRLLSGLLIFCIIHTGCSSSYLVSSSPSAEQSFSTFNADAKDKSVTIVLQDGRKLDARGVIAEPDSTSFLNAATGARTVVSTHEIKKIILTNRVLGALEGAGIGLLSGGGAGLLAAYILVPSPKELEALAYIFLPAIGGGAGLLTGSIIGVLGGHTYEYNFASDLNKPSD